MLLLPNAQARRRSPLSTKNDRHGGDAFQLAVDDAVHLLQQIIVAAFGFQLRVNLSCRLRDDPTYVKNEQRSIPQSEYSASCIVQAAGTTFAGEKRPQAETRRQKPERFPEKMGIRHCGQRTAGVTRVQFVALVCNRVILRPCTSICQSKNFDKTALLVHMIFYCTWSIVLSSHISLPSQAPMCHS